MWLQSVLLGRVSHEHNYYSWTVLYVTTISTPGPCQSSTQLLLLNGIICDYNQYSWAVSVINTIITPERYYKWLLSVLLGRVSHEHNYYSWTVLYVTIINTPGPCQSWTQSVLLNGIFLWLQLVLLACVRHKHNNYFKVSTSITPSPGRVIRECHYYSSAVLRISTIITSRWVQALLPAQDVSYVSVIITPRLCKT